MQTPEPTSKGSVKRLLIPLGLLALYPLLILVLQLAEAPTQPELAVDLVLTPEVSEDQRAAVTVLVRNAEPHPVELDMLMVNLIRGDQPERSLIEDRPALAHRLGGEPIVDPESAASLGRFHIDLLGGDPADLVFQVSLNVIDPRTGNPRQVTREATAAGTAAFD